MLNKFMRTALAQYEAGNPIISDEQYDYLESISNQMLLGSGDVPHAYRMYSLKKHYVKDGEPPLRVSQCVETPKLDGLAMSILYVGGKFVQALRRGNGVLGTVIPEIEGKLDKLGIAKSITDTGIVQITGEVAASSNVPNSRNFASGALNTKDLVEFEEKADLGKIRFFAYNVQEDKDYWGFRGKDYIAEMLCLQDWGFSTVVQAEELEGYPTDGKVYRLVRTDMFNEAGFTDKFPRGAYALKEEQESVETTLLDVVWQCGKSGKVTPVAILDPIVIGEATIGRATLNNYGFIEALNLEIGCRVNVIRAGEIIPTVVSRAD